MAYEKHSWSCGEKITADKMNNLENGIEEALDCCGGGTDLLVVDITAYAPQCGGTYVVTPSHTYDEISEAFENGKLVVFRTEHWCDSTPHNILVNFAKRSDNPGMDYSFYAYSPTSGGKVITTYVDGMREWHFVP